MSIVTSRICHGPDANDIAELVLREPRAAHAGGTRNADAGGCCGARNLVSKRSLARQRTLGDASRSTAPAPGIPPNAADQLNQLLIGCLGYALTAASPQPGTAVRSIPDYGNTTLMLWMAS